MTISVRPSLSRDRARALVKLGMQAEITAEHFRDLVLEEAVEGVDLAALQEPARHRLALQVLRAWDLWPQWRRMYGSGLLLPERMRRVIMPVLREQARAHTVGEFQSDLRETTAVVSLRGTEAIREMATRLQEPMRALQRAAEVLLAPLRQAMDSVRALVDRVLTPIREAIGSVVQGPAIRIASDMLNKRLSLGQPGGSVSALLDAYRRSTAPPKSVALVLPDDDALVAVFVHQRGDGKWRKGPLGWLLRLLPIRVSTALHTHLGDSSEAALAWLAERYLRRELRRVIEPALTKLDPQSETQEVLVAGLDHYFKEEWAVADTLLTAGLEGLVFDLAVRQGVLTPGHRLRRPDGIPGAKIPAAGNARLLSAMGFDGSQIGYLTTLSLGSTGNGPRHGAASAIGPEVHAAGALLGVLLVVQWALQDRRLVAHALLTA